MDQIDCFFPPGLWQQLTGSKSLLQHCGSWVVDKAEFSQAAKHHNSAAIPLLCRLGTLPTHPCPQRTREVPQAGGAVGSQLILPPGCIFHLNCAYSAVGMHWYLAGFFFFKKCKGPFKNRSKSFWDRGLAWEWGSREKKIFHLLSDFRCFVCDLQRCLQAVLQSLFLIRINKALYVGSSLTTSFILCAFLWR